LRRRAGQLLSRQAQLRRERHGLTFKNEDVARWVLSRQW
jgi:hypothetical protein